MKRRKTVLTLCILVLVLSVPLTACDSKTDPELERILSKKDDRAVLTLYYPEDNSLYSRKFPSRDVRETISKRALEELNRRLSVELNIVLQLEPIPKFVWRDEDSPEVSYPGYNELLYEMLESGKWKTFDKGNRSAPYNETGQIADAFFIDSWAYATLAKKGLLADIGHSFSEHAPELYRKYPPNRLKKTEYNGRLVALPSLMEDCVRLYAIIREDLLDAAGMETVNTLEEYETFMRNVKDIHPQIIPGSVRTQVRTGGTLQYWYGSIIRYNLIDRVFAENCGYAFLDEFLSFAYKKDDPKKKIILYPDTEDAKEGYQLIARWEEMGYVKPYLYDIDESFDDNSTDMLLGRLASCIGTWQQAIRLNDMLVENKLGHLRVKAFPLYMENMAVKTSPTSAAIAFNPLSQKTARALEFFQWLHQKQENYDLLMYGIKGEDYHLIGDQLDISATKIPEAYDYFSDWRKAVANMDYLRFNTSVRPGYKDELVFQLGFNAEYALYEGWYPDFSHLTHELLLPCFTGSFSLNDREMHYVQLNLYVREDPRFTELTSEANMYQLQQQWDTWRKNQ